MPVPKPMSRTLPNVTVDAKRIYKKLPVTISKYTGTYINSIGNEIPITQDEYKRQLLLNPKFGNQFEVNSQIPDSNYIPQNPNGFNQVQMATGGQLQRQNNASMNPYLYNSLPQYGLGSWLEENAGTIGSIAGGIGGFAIGGPAGMALGSAALGGLGSMVTNGHNQGEQNDQNADQLKLQQQQMSVQNATDNYRAQEHPMYGTNFAMGGKLNSNLPITNNPGELTGYNMFRGTLPGNQANNSSYDLLTGWKDYGKPMNFKSAQQLQYKDSQPFMTRESDGYHAKSAGYNEQTGNYDFLKDKNHPSLKNELDWYNSKDGESFKNQYDLDKSGNYYKYVPKKSMLEVGRTNQQFAIGGFMPNVNTWQYSNVGGMNYGNGGNMENKEYNDLKSFIQTARQAIGTNDSKLLSTLRLDKPYNSNDLTKDYIRLRQLAKESGNNSLIEEASTLFPHVGQQIRGNINSILGTHYANGGNLNNDNKAAQMTRGLDNITVYPSSSGSHETNKNGGVNIGSYGQVEKNEVRFGTYVFSDRLPYTKSKQI